MTAPKSKLLDEEVAQNILDKLSLKQLHLIEEKLSCELNIESGINNGSIHLAKSRYIMGHNSVSATQLPGEQSQEFFASTLSEPVTDSYYNSVQKLDNNEGTVNPMHWFGVLVPQNMYKAQSYFKNVLDYVIDCINIQRQIQFNAKVMNMLKGYC